MNIAVVLNVHENSPVVFDTLESILKYATQKVLVIVDGAGWDQLASVPMPAYKLEGFYHACNRAPYRNVALGLKKAWELWSNEVDWICYAEYDCLFGSGEFKRYLEAANRSDIWCLGNDFRVSNIKFPLIEAMLKEKIKYTGYLLGCCVFYHRNFFKKLAEVNFFERFLYLTNEFSQGFFPGYEEQGGYDLSEHLYPTLAAHYGGKIAQLANWSERTNKWSGYYDKFLCRFRPDLIENFDNYKGASILHPLKDYSNPIREYHREKRKNG